MSKHLDPIILKQLRAFARRRRSLILVRGVLATLAMLVGAMVAVAAVDFWVPLMADWVRWVLSAGAYLSVVVIAWRYCLDQLLHAPDERQVARLVEFAEPKLREDLLSAVELGQGSGSGFDSEEFRKLLQTDVSSRVAGLEVRALLPVGLIARSILILGVIALAVSGLLMKSENRFGTLFLRALMPGANLDNVARTHLRMIEPERGDREVAQGDAVRVIVQVEGLDAKAANLEVQGLVEGRRVLKMEALADRKFRATIQVGREDVKYRMQAGDGRTKYYTLTAVARPHEVAFEKTYVYPEYSKIPVRKVEETQGGLEGLEGTEVELKIRLNQELRSGELRLDRGAKTSVIGLKALGDGRWGARVPLTASGSYRLHLVGLKTGFESKFSPEYEIRAEADLAPTVEIEQPEGDLLSPANELIRLVGRAGDDIGLAKIVQVVKVNDRPWKEVVLREHGGKSETVKRDWDLTEEGVKTNDLITTKLVATDFKGSKVESRALQVVVVASATEMRRLAGLASRKVLGQALEGLAKSGEALEEAARVVQLKFEAGESGESGRVGALGTLVKANADYAGKLSEAWMALQVPLRDSPANHESADLVLMGRLLSRIQHEELGVAGKYLELVAGKPGTIGGRELVEQVHGSAARANGWSLVARDVYRFNLSGEQIDLVAELGLLLSAEQRRIREMAAASQEAGAWGRVSTRVQAILKVSKNLDGVLESLKGGGGPIAGQADGLLTSNFFSSTRTRLEDVLNAGVGEEEMMGVFESFSKNFGRAVSETINAKVKLSALAQEYLVAKGKIPVGGVAVPVGLAASLQQYLTEELEPTWVCLEQFRRSREMLEKLGKLTAEERAPLVKAGWSAVSDTFRAHADLEEVRAVADNGFVSDLRRATVAMLSVEALSAGDGVEKTNGRIDSLEQSMRVLETGHQLQEMIDGMVALIAADRWEVRLPHARTTMPRDWAWISTRMQMLSGEMRGLVLRDPGVGKTVGVVAKMVGETVTSPAFRAVTFEMGERRKFKHTPQVIRVELEQVVGKVRASLAMLRGSMELARRDLLKLTPSISELALALAAEELGVKKDSNQSAGKVSVGKMEEAKVEARPQLVRQQGINGKIETLKDLIRADANEQNILKKGQRERMRDADDALAMLKEPPGAAASALLQVTTGLDKGQVQTDYDQAVEQEQLTAEALQKIGGHYAALEQGKNLEETRLALRKEEEKLGIKQELDKEFAKAEMLAEMALKTTEELIKELEAKLPDNPEMQKELDKIAKTTLDIGSEELQRAAKAEGVTAGKVDERVKKDGDAKQSMSALAAAKLAAALSREAEVASGSAEKALEEAQNKSGMERGKATIERMMVAVVAADQLVEAAQRLENSRLPAEILVEANAVLQKIGPLIQPLDQGRNQSKSLVQIAEAQAQKADDGQAGNRQAVVDGTVTIEKTTAAIEAAQLAEAAARDAAERASAMAKVPDHQPANSKLAAASLDQIPVQGDASEAAADLARAARHEARLGSPEAGEKIGELAKRVEATSKGAVPAAEKALKESKEASGAQAPVRKAATELADEAAELKEAVEEAKSASPPASESSAAEASELTPAEQQELAKALDALDQQASDAAAAAAAAAAAPPGEAPPGEGPPGEGPPGEGPPGEGPPGEGPPGEGPPGEGPPGEGPPGAMAGLAKSAMASLRQGRAMKPSPMPGLPAPFSESEKSEKGAKLDVGASTPGAIAELAALKRGDWGKLPKKLAEQLSKGQGEEIPNEYREAVEIYYRVIAERSKKQ